MTQSARVALLVGLLLIASWAVAGREPRHITLATPLADFPLLLDNWRGADAGDLDPEEVAVLGADEYLNRVYSDGHRSAMSLYVAYYGSQTQGDSIHSPRHCLPGTGWQPIAQSRTTVEVAGQHLPLNRYVVQRRGDRQLVLYWFQGRGRVVASEYSNKFYLLTDALRLRRTDGALVRVVTPLRSAGATPDREALEFVRALQPTLGRWL